MAFPRRAFLTSFDKDGVAELGKELADNGAEIISFGDTATTLLTEGLQVTPASDLIWRKQDRDRCETGDRAEQRRIIGDYIRPLLSLGDKELSDSGYSGRIDLVLVNLRPPIITQDGRLSLNHGGMDYLDAALEDVLETERYVLTSPKQAGWLMPLLTAPEQLSAEQAAEIRVQLATDAFAHRVAHENAAGRLLQKEFVRRVESGIYNV